MKFPRPLALLTAGLISFASAPASAKPPAASPSPTAAPDKSTTNPTAAWLLQQDGGKDAIALPLAQVVRAATGKQVVSFDPANPEYASFLKWFGALMDRVLPRINRPDSPAHAAARLAETDEVAARVEDEIRNVMRDFAAFRSPVVTNADFHGRGYPALRMVSATSGKTYYLSVTLYASGEREKAVPAFRFDPGESLRQITADGYCLLVGIEYHGKLDGDIAFLNWDVTDVSAVPVRAAITFRADAADVYHPGAVLTDGRKGSD